MAEAVFDVVVIGAGPGGYIAAIRAAQLGLKVACVDKEARFGGTCLRVGCIPSKALLDASEKFYQAKHGFAGLGITFEGIKLDLGALMAKKEKVVETLTTGVSGLMKKNKIEKIVGTAKFVSVGAGGGKQLEITGADGAKSGVSAKHVIIATGSVPVELPFMKFDGKAIISSDQGIALTKVPESLVVIGGGAIGLELGSVWSRLGSKVTVLEMLPQVVMGSDEEMARGLERVLKKQGLNFYLGAKVTGVKDVGGKKVVTFEWEGKQMSEPAEVVLVAVGRKSYTAGVGLDVVGVKVDERGRVVTDAHFKTNVEGVSAIGDCVAGPMLAHKAEEEGVACAEMIAGKAGHVNYNVIPAVVYTSPELAWVGLTEEQCKAKGVAVNVGKFQFRANARALCMDAAEGFVKVIADAKTDRVLGVHILGVQASSLIGEAAVVMEFAGSAEDIARTCHAHPTLPEALKEAALGVHKRMLNS